MSFSKRFDRPPSKRFDRPPGLSFPKAMIFTFRGRRYLRRTFISLDAPLLLNMCVRRGLAHVRSRIQCPTRRRDALSVLHQGRKIILDPVHYVGNFSPEEVGSTDSKSDHRQESH
jgi:hypothetical protein